MDTKAVLVERATDWNGWRSIMFTIDHESGAASVMEICEAPTARDALEILLEPWENEPIAVKVWGPSDRTPDAVMVGNHWVVWPDALSVVETAEALHDLDPAETYEHRVVNGS